MCSDNNSNLNYYKLMCLTLIRPGFQKSALKHYNAKTSLIDQNFADEEDSIAVRIMINIALLMLTNNCDVLRILRHPWSNQNQMTHACSLEYLWGLQEHFDQLNGKPNIVVKYMYANGYHFYKCISNTRLSYSTKEIILIRRKALKYFAYLSAMPPDVLTHLTNPLHLQ